MTNENRIFSLFGLATKAGKVTSGEFSTEKSVKDCRSHLVVIASDASDNTKKMFRNMCSYYKVPIYYFATKAEIGHAIGKEMRASLSVNDEGFAKSLIKLLDTGIINKENMEV